MEPAWVYDREPIDVVSWTIRRRKWNKEARKMDLLATRHEGSTLDLLQSLVDTLKSGDYECDYDINAEYSAGEISDKPRHYSLTYPSGYDLCLDWSISGEVSSEDVGYCTDELMGWVEHYVDAHKTFTVSLCVADPTP
jgi:hypothetical protein